MPAKLILVDDHRMFLDGLVSILATETDHEILLQANSGQKVIDYLQKSTEVDLVITDVNMDEMDGVALNVAIKKDFPNVKTLAVSMRHDPTTVHALTSGGVNGYVPKNAEKSELLLAIATVLRGDRYFSKEIQEAYMSSMFGQTKEAAVEVKLTRREKEILTLIAAEQTTAEIAATLFLSKHTIEGYRKSLISKLDVRNVAGLVKEAVKRGLV